jgi:putative DNA primase/helicase
LWRGAGPAPGTPADTYLTGRGLPGLAGSDALRFRRDTPHPEQRGRLPAMLALVVDVSGAPIAVHRTYLRSDGAGKAEVTPAKASIGPVSRGAIRLDPVAAELVIGEGIESSASAGRRLGLPAWAAISAGNLARALVLPPEVRRVVIAADHDLPNANGQRPGQDAAWRATRRWRAEGRLVHVATPGEGAGA